VLRKSVIAFALVLLAWLIAAGAAQAVSSGHPPRGTMVDIGGRRLRLVCEGPTGGPAPTVWMEAGAFGGAADFAAVQQRLVEKGLRACAYDRAGMGYSDPGPSPRDGAAIVADLEKLIAASGERGPIVLIAHSMGGLYVRQYAVRHPGQVVGLVLVEAVTPELMEIPQVQAFFSHFLTFARLNAAVAPLGLTKPGYFFLSDRIGLSPAAAREKRAALTSARQARAAVDEVRHWPEAARQAAAAGAYDPALPIAVVTADRGGVGRSAWEDARRLPADRSAAGSYTPVPGASHSSILGFDHNAAIVAAALRVVASADARAHATQAQRREGP
jgi:pimeloyl-ACP methyl ester carboxylesterase